MRTLSRKSFAIGLLVALLVVYTGRAVPVSALAVGPLADPVYETEIYAFKDYVEQNLDAPQLDIMFFLIGGLAVAQLGAQDAMLISPYPNEENVKEWLINCGIQLYNSVIGLVPEGDYFMGIPSIGMPSTKGVPRQVLKALVAQMMGDAVVAINYRDLDEFLEEHPNELYIPFNRDLQLGLNAVFGLNGGANDWQITEDSWKSPSFYYPTYELSSNALSEYNALYSQYILTPAMLWGTIRGNGYFAGSNMVSSNIPRIDLFINTTNHTVGFHTQNFSSDFVYYYYYSNSSMHEYTPIIFRSLSYDPNNFNNYIEIASYFLDLYPTTGPTAKNTLAYMETLNGGIFYPNYALLVNRVMVGGSYETAVEIHNTTDLDFDIDNIEYYEQVTNDYLLDIRGLIGDLVNYVYVRKPVFDNIYDLEGNNVVPILVKISTELENLTQLIAPPVPVNLNDIAEYTDNTYLERVKEHARNAGDIFANYVAFWHNCDSDLIYTMFGAAILVLVGAFVGKWGHS